MTVILGCGYVGSRLARTLLAEGHPVRVCARHLDRLAPLATLGAELYAIDATKPKQFGPALHGTTSATVVYSIPPPPSMPGGEAVRRATQAALNTGARNFIYLGSTGLYGSQPDADWVDENTAVASSDPAMAPRLQDEGAVQAASSAGLHTVILRLAAIYGPRRGVRQRLASGQYQLIDEGRHYFSRIHVDDIVGVIRAAAERAPRGAIYLVADDHPCPQREYAEWLCRRLGLPLPPSVPALAPGVARTMLRGRRVRNDKLKRELGLSLLYPSYAEGEVQIEEELGLPPAGSVASIYPAAASPAAAATAAPDIASPLVTEAAAGPAPAVAAASARPACIRHYTTLPEDAVRNYPGSSELLSVSTMLGRPLGLKRLGVRHELVPPGHRTSWPHAHATEEELLYVLEGTPHVWLDGVLHPLAPGDVVAFPAGTGQAHTVLNNSDQPVRLLVVGEQRRADDRVAYPLHPAREASLPNERRWTDAPRHPLGPHDGLPDAQRKR